MREPFDMPSVSLGETVVYWPGGVRETGRAEVGDVIGISPTGRSVNLRLARGESKYGVRHINDTRLKENDEMRSEGAWEFTAQHLAIETLKVNDEETRKTVAELKDALAQIQKTLNSAEQAPFEASNKKTK